MPLGKETPYPDPPNLPELTGTTLPLLATILAGFAVTISVDLMTEAERGASWFPSCTFIGFTLLMASAPWFLAATFCAAWSQAYNYQKLTNEFRSQYGEETEHLDAAWRTYRSTCERNWKRWYDGANRCFKAAFVLFVGGVLFVLGGEVGWWAVGPMVICGSVAIAVGVWTARTMD